METQTEADYSEMSEEELVEEHETLLRLQEQDFDAGNSEGAKIIAQERMKVWNVAQSKGINL